MTPTYVTLFARDVDRLAAFYMAALGLEEIEDSRSVRYREVSAPPIRIGFAYQGLYAMLDLADEADPRGARSVLTFDVGLADAVLPAVDRAVAAGATLRKAPFDTFFGQHQAVLQDPEGNILRLSAPVAA